ncbi:MAG: hypothetical protein A3F70_00225 [Acidobacteria bacterium RIFCSPLOWO2_12_FULL_67_14]|nr:MAG: hypothetical protein A3H29_17290 [Acidobacteria bacterium RIFCSPLOWO2_02_FULL_67_21]OFW41364.1 MAG: hypothetical protein A3F70_00225 [Acidobacteria bacterium RIFCSPLOWO2_12_FULL_67_14]
MHAGEVLLRLRAVRKDYGALRPLRVEAFELREAETVGVVGLDSAAAEALVNLITAATLPDEGQIDIFGAPTVEIADADTWLRSLDRFGLVSERVALVNELSIEQNLALPLSLDVADMAPDLRGRVQQLAAEVGMTSADAERPLSAATADLRQRIRLAKALALDPKILLAEHPNAAVPRQAAGRLASDMAAIAARRRIAMLVLTADTAFARAACARVMTWQPSTGSVTLLPWWRRSSRRPGSAAQP